MRKSDTDFPRKKTILSISVLLISGLLFSFYFFYLYFVIDAEMSNPYHKALNANVSINTRSVTILFGRDIYEIPRNYLVSLTLPQSPGGYAQFAIQVLLPKFEPRTVENIDLFNVAGNGDKLRADIEFGVTFDSPMAILHRIFSRKGCEYYVDKSFQYDHYHLKNCATDPDIYVKRYDDGNIFYLTCSSYKNVPSPSCVVVENIGMNRRIYYSFGLKYINYAMNIDFLLRNLIESFSHK